MYFETSIVIFLIWGNMCILIELNNTQHFRNSVDRNCICYQFISCSWMPIHSVIGELYYPRKNYHVNKFLDLFHRYCFYFPTSFNGSNPSVINFWLIYWQQVKCYKYLFDIWYVQVVEFSQTLRKNWSFPSRISSVNVTKSTACGFGHIYWRNP